VRIRCKTQSKTSETQPFPSALAGLFGSCVQEEPCSQAATRNATCISFVSQEIFKKLDTDGSNSLTLKELKAWESGSFQACASEPPFVFFLSVPMVC